ncbi:hypothetical protein F4859DRAFT_524165 [Xylaria cf. heliscus]|nr:hypothetical protein F4859DRAFT_524165 [Xylaria cf. heliscus]
MGFDHPRFHDASARSEAGPDEPSRSQQASVAGAQPHQPQPLPYGLSSTLDEHVPCTHFHNVPRTGCIDNSTLSHGPPSCVLSGQRLITRWESSGPMFYTAMFPQREPTPEHGNPSVAVDTKGEVKYPWEQASPSSLYTPPASIAQMYSPGQKTLSECCEEDLIKIEKDNDAQESGNGAASVSNTPHMMTGVSLDTGETLISGGNGVPVGNDNNNTTTNNGNNTNGNGIGHHFNGADGVIDTRILTVHTNGYYYVPNATGVDIDNSLRIDKAGDFHLGPQWQVPSSKTAQSHAGPKFGEASIWSEWSQQRSNSPAPLSMPEVHTPPTDEVIAYQMQTLDLANMHRPHKPLPGLGDHNGSMGHVSRDYRSSSSSTEYYQAIPAPLTAALACNNNDYLYELDDDEHDICVVAIRGPDGSYQYHQVRREPQAAAAAPAAPAAQSYNDGYEAGNDDDDCFLLKEGPISVDISMQGAL